MNFLSRLRQFFQPEGATAVSSNPLPDPVSPRVMLIIHNPTVPSQGNKKLSQALRWHDPDRLAAAYIQDIQEASYGYVHYQIAERVEVDACPVKEDGFSYDGEGYYQRWYTRTGWHQPDRVDYGRILDEFQIIPRINLGQIDEVWLLGFPYAGYYESMMVGPGAFWCNAPGMAYGRCQRKFIIMGFNYERGVGEMLESFGHRVESIMSHVFRDKRGDRNLWERFTRYDKIAHGRAECGNVHFAPNSERDYDWGNPRYVPSRCDTWYNFPDLSGPPRQVNCTEWGNGDIRLHHLWWLRHLPHIAGSSGGLSHNWWEYIIDPNRVA